MKQSSPPPPKKKKAHGVVFTSPLALMFWMGNRRVVRWPAQQVHTALGIRRRWPHSSSC